MQLVVGLGNSGPRYSQTRHNVGFMVVDRLAERHQGLWAEDAASHSQLAQVEIGGIEVLLVKPQTFMNRSGETIRALRDRFWEGPEDMLIVLDDFLLDFGRLRYRRKGSDGGHNGMASVTAKTHSTQIPRLRVGIGAPPPGQDSVEFVLAPFPDPKALGHLVARGCESIEVYIERGIDVAMNRFNSC